MVISSLVVETTPGKVHAVAEELAKIPGVEVHNDEGYKIVVTIETETTRQSHDVAAGFIGIPGVSNVNLIYVNFEDDPALAGPCLERRGERQWRPNVKPKGTSR